MPNLIGRCPVCTNEMTVTRLHCEACQTALEGRFRLGRFASLPAEHLAFLDVFVKNRGIIKDVEAELGLSYRTVVGRLDDLLRVLGHPAAGDETPRTRAAPVQAREERRRILEELRDQRITADDAARLLSAIGGRG